MITSEVDSDSKNATLKREDKNKTNMAEEHLTDDDMFTHDDMSVLRVLMHEVRGLNATSSAPAHMISEEEANDFELDFDQAA